ncbi:MAG: MoaD/ThiS family protein [Synergistetes bacterium]|nr:MAG: ThiS family protein [bacterium 42_11]MBC7331169.1 MoaD/ThiS family protein [Synergistota bacterium]
MSIKVLSFLDGEVKTFKIETDTPLTVREILVKLSIPLDRFGIAISNGKVITLEGEIAPHSEVRLIPPVGGG